MKHIIRCDDIGARCGDITLNAETSALDVETSAFGVATSAIARRSFDATISALGAATSAIPRSYWRYRRGVSSNIGDCGVGITPQMCNRVTNHGDMSTFSKPDYVLNINVNNNKTTDIVCNVDIIALMK